MIVDFCLTVMYGNVRRAMLRLSRIVFESASCIEQQKRKLLKL